MKTIDLTGQKFGRLTVVERAESNTLHGAARWICKCECGNSTVVIGDELRKGNTKSCGCYAKEVSKATALKNIAGKNKTHGIARTPIYKEWTQMKQRCNNPKASEYNIYGGNGRKVCDEWQNSFEAFYNDVSKLPHFGEVGYSLDRIDNDGNYEPNNVRWATAAEQSNNRSTNHCVEYKGKTYTIMELSKRYNVPYKKLYKRYVTLHWNIEKALNTP